MTLDATGRRHAAALKLPYDLDLTVATNARVGALIRGTAAEARVAAEQAAAAGGIKGVKEVEVPPMPPNQVRDGRTDGQTRAGRVCVCLFPSVHKPRWCMVVCRHGRIVWMLRFTTNARRASPPPPPACSLLRTPRKTTTWSPTPLPLRSLFSRRLVFQIVLAKLTVFLAIASYAVGSWLERLVPTELAELEALPPPGADGGFDPIAKEDEWLERITVCFVARWFFVWSLNAPPKTRRRLGNTKVKALERAETARAPRRWATFRLDIVYARVKVRRRTTREITGLAAARHGSSIFFRLLGVFL